ncbi:MAG: hypothetical protein C0174_00445 [Thermodesulfobium narugense]|nr:MAG: hypothetical protein C0174_00445 [Thermodesulfobium narugense]
MRSTGVGKKAFNCPFCDAYAHQEWDYLGIDRAPRGCEVLKELKVCFCSHCNKFSIWYQHKMIYPEFAGIEPPNGDLDPDIQRDYLEAASILQKSPRGAAALLRLAIQKLMKQLGEKGENLNTDIANLVKKGLPVLVQKSLDILRVIGNEAVHPGQLDLRDDQETAEQLFKLVNFIAEQMITEPKKIEEIYNKIPESKKQQIEKRNEEAKK